MSTVERKLSHGTTVADLISELEGLPQDAVVLFACDYGDHCHTTQALPIERIVARDSNSLYESAYSNSGVALRDESEDDDNRKPADRDNANEPRTIIVLS